MRTHDGALLGSWVRRFLLEHLVVERNLSRNTQRSYRDSLRLLIPFAVRCARGPVFVDRAATACAAEAAVPGHLDTLRAARGRRGSRALRFRPLRDARDGS